MPERELPLSCRPSGAGPFDRPGAVIVRNVPNVRKAVKSNTPFYGIEGQGWFLSIHCLTK